MGIKSDKVYGCYTQGALKQAAAKAYLQVIGENEDQGVSANLQPKTNSTNHSPLVSK